MDFKDLDELWDYALELPIRGRTYRIEDPTADLGLYCRRLWETGLEAAGAVRAGGDPELDAKARTALQRFAALPPPPGLDNAADLGRAILGPACQQMIDDGVSHRMIEHAGQTAIAWVAGGDDMARAYWLSAGRPNAEALNRAARRHPPTSSSSTGEAPGTRTAASSSGTSSRRNSRRRRRGPQ